MKALAQSLGRPFPGALQKVCLHGSASLPSTGMYIYPFFHDSVSSLSRVLGPCGGLVSPCPPAHHPLRCMGPFAPLPWTPINTTLPTKTFIPPNYFLLPRDTGQKHKTSPLSQHPKTFPPHFHGLSGLSRP